MAAVFVVRAVFASVLDRDREERRVGEEEAGGAPDRCCRRCARTEHGARSERTRTRTHAVRST
eukprot:6192918-Pleurochrysis_carterae.AAC.1